MTRLKRLSEMTDAELDQQIAWAKEDGLLLDADIAQLTSASASAMPESASAASGSSLRASSKTRSPE